MKLTNDELLKMSDPNTPQAVKDHICQQKMTSEEIGICRQVGVTLSSYMVTKSLDK